VAAYKVGIPLYELQCSPTVQVGMVSYKLQQHPRLITKIFGAASLAQKTKNAAGASNSLQPAAFFVLYRTLDDSGMKRSKRRSMDSYSRFT
jgi:hypothetical protein